MQQDASRPKLWITMELCDAGSITDTAKRSAPKHIPELVREMFHHTELYVLKLPELKHSN